MKARLQLIVIVSVLGALAGCGSPGNPLPPSLELPRTASDLAAVRKGNRVTLTWTMPTQTTDGQNIRAKKLGPAQVCRSVARFPMQGCEQVVGEIAAEKITVNKPGEKPVKVTFTDTLAADLEQQHATEFAGYAVSLTNWRGRTAGLSNQVRVPLAPVQAAPADVKAEVTAEGVNLSFQGGVTTDSNGLDHKYRIFRRTDAGTGAVAIGDATTDAGVPAEAQPVFTLADRAFEWEKTYYYHVTPVTVVTQKGQKVAEVEGDDSPEVKVFTHDTFPPAAPSGLQAVFSGVGQEPFIDLTWAPNTDADLAGYNVYRQEQGQPAVRINAELAKTPSFRDENVVSGRTYVYTATAVDLRGNESRPSEETSERAP